MTITLNDPIQKKSVIRQSNGKVDACRTNIFGVLSALGNRVDLFSGTSFFDPDKKLLQRIFLKSPYIRCTLWIDGKKHVCLGVQV
jgi:hypothetical protein